MKHCSILALMNQDGDMIDGVNYRLVKAANCEGEYRADPATQ